MKILLKDILFEDIEREWDEDVEEANALFNIEPHNTLKLIVPFHVTMKLHRIGDNVDIVGKYEGKLEFVCDRCSEKSYTHLEERFHYLLQPKKPGEEAIEEGDEELEVGYYEGDEIDLSELAIEHLMLSIPMRMLCKEDCKGICPYCGGNKNERECDCEKKAGKSNPFSILIN
ncbi:MAG: DUF177 domain-containing protein [Proteobacteria bacterium]|nr:DUF177 domain-containing protein [Pseudomonadota bacterium]